MPPSKLTFSVHRLNKSQKPCMHSFIELHRLFYTFQVFICCVFPYLPFTYCTCGEAIQYYKTLQRKNAENLKQIFPEKEYRGPSPNFHIHVSVSELYIPTLELPFLLEEICGPILGIYKLLPDT